MNNKNEPRKILGKPGKMTKNSPRNLVKVGISSYESSGHPGKNMSS